MHKVILNNWGKMNLTERTRIRKAITTHWHRGKWQAVMVISTLKAATRKTLKRTRKVRSDSHTGQYAGSISPDHSQRQMLVEPLAFPGVARHINKFLRKTTQKRGSGLAIYTLVALEVMIFLAFCGLSFCGRRTGLSGRVFIVALSKSVHNCCVPHQAQASVPGAQSQAIWPPSIVSQAHRLQGRGETNAGQWPLEDGVNGWVPWEAACIFSTGEAMEPQLINNFATAASWAFKDFGTSSEGIAIRSSSGLSKFPTLAIGNASDQAAVWLSCAASNRQWFQVLLVFSRDLLVFNRES